MKDEYSVDYSIPENEVLFLKGMIREYYQPEIERLHSIIKEVREYIEKTKFKYCDDELCYMIENHYNRILEILEKES